MNWLMMTSRFARISSGRWIGYAWVVALAGSLALSGWLAHQRTKKVEEYPFGCDSFGYLWMAQEIRQAAAGRRLPQFRLETEHTRLLIELLRSRGVPVESWDEMIAPHAHHYFPAANHVGVQYPPGTGLLLALFPQGEAVSGLNHAVILLFLTAGFSLLAFAAARRAWVSAGFVALALHLGLDILANIGDISFSINAVLVPLLFSFLCLFGARWLRLRRARTGLDADDTESAAAAGSGDFAPRLLALAGGLFFGFAVLVRLPVLFLLPGLFVLLWPAHSSLSWQLRRALAPRALLRSDLILFSAVVFLCGLVPLLAHQYRMAGAWYLSTYGRADNASPNLDTVSRNLSYYLGTGPGAEDNWALFAIFAGFAGFAFYFHRCGRAARDFGLMSWQRVALAALVLWGVPTAYFLTHAIRIHYYPKPSTFGAALLLALGALTIEGRAARLTVPEAGGTPHWSLR
ncbi:MAG: hypothetical protein ACRD9R_17510, partial [Pyrinomonadaceae bacterium]